MAADPRFHPAGPALSLAELAAIAGGELRSGDPGRRISGVGALAAAGPDEVTYCEDRRNAALLASCRAGAVLLPAELAAQVPPGTAAIVTATPRLAYARAATALHPPCAPKPGVHPSAVVDPTAEIGEGTEIGPFAVVGAGALVGARCILGPHSVVGAGVVLGEGCRIGAHASITHCVAERGVVLHPGARVGQEGFGFVPTPEGRFLTVPQLGIVRLGEFVEIGANACVDRGALGDTVLGPGTRLDNMVQIGHNVRAGRGCILVAQVGIAGSATIGDWVQMGGQAGVSGHVTIGARARIGGQAGVTNDVEPGLDMFGTPARPKREFVRSFEALRALGRKSGAGG